MTTTYDMPAALRAAAAHVETHPDLPTPYITAGSWGVSVAYQLSISAKDNQRETASEIRRSIGGTWEKQDLGDTFLMRRHLGLLRIEIAANREEICERRVVGTETVTVPAVEAQPERTETREVVEWDCSPVLATAEVS